MTEPQSNLTNLAIRTFWQAAIAWLVLCNLSTANFVVLWFIEPANPLRHELIIGLSVSVLLAGPAIVAVFVYCAFLARFTRPIERRVGLALALSCVAMAAAPWIIHKVPFARFSKQHALVKLAQTKGSSAACQGQPHQGNFSQVFVLLPPSTTLPSLTVGSTRTPT